MREGSWTPCARSASVWVAWASGRSQPLLDRIGLGWVPELEALLMPDHFQGEYVISKQSLNSPHPEPAFPQPQSCLASHSCGCGCSDPAPGSPKAPLGYKQAGLWWQEGSGVLILVQGDVTSLFVDQRLLSKYRESLFYLTGRVILCHD